MSLLSLQAYLDLRKGGNNDLGDVVLSLSTQLSEFDYRETFTGAFEVRHF
jgi:hypothetical protein